MSEVGEYVSLITQLRRAAQDTESGEMDGLLTAAADAIERLQAEAEAWECGGEELAVERGVLWREVAELRLTVLGYVQAKVAADAELMAARSLRDALERTERLMVFYSADILDLDDPWRPLDVRERIQKNQECLTALNGPAAVSVPHSDHSDVPEVEAAHEASWAED